MAQTLNKADSESEYISFPRPEISAPSVPTPASASLRLHIMASKPRRNTGDNSSFSSSPSSSPAKSALLRNLASAKSRQDSGDSLNRQLKGLVPNNRSNTPTDSRASSVSVPAMKEDLWDWIYEKIVGRGDATQRHHARKLEKHYAKHMSSPSSSRPSTSSSSVRSEEVYSDSAFEEDEDDYAIGDSPELESFSLEIDNDTIDEQYYSYFMSGSSLTRDAKVTARGRPLYRHHRNRRGPVYAAGAEHWLNCVSSAESSCAPEPKPKALADGSTAPIDIPEKQKRNKTYIGPYSVGVQYN